MRHHYDLVCESESKKNGNGSKASPFKRIGQAAKAAMAGDEIRVAPGVYREEVSPVFAGTAEKPIVYISEVPRAATITGADPFDNWEHYKDDVWKQTVPND